jgi:YHS domain-containing protein
MTVIDPVCGMDVDPDTAEWKTDYQGQTYYFCAPGCQRAFEKEPQKYVSVGARPAPDEHAGQGHAA